MDRGMERFYRSLRGVRSMLKQLKLVGSILWIVTAVMVIAVMVLDLLSFSIPPEGRQEWLQSHQEQRRIAAGASGLNAVLLDERQADALTIQLWQLEMDGGIYDDVVVWKQGLTGLYRVQYEEMYPRELDEAIRFGFMDSPYWYSCRSNRQLQLMEPARTFHITFGLVAFGILFAADILVTVLYIHEKRNAREHSLPEKELP